MLCQSCGDAIYTNTGVIENNGVSPDWGCNPFSSDSISFNENRITSVITEFSLCWRWYWCKRALTLWLTAEYKTVAVFFLQTKETLFIEGIVFGQRKSSATSLYEIRSGTSGFTSVLILKKYLTHKLLTLWITGKTVPFRFKLYFAISHHVGIL